MQRGPYSMLPRSLPPSMFTSQSTSFECPNCAAKYELVRAEAPRGPDQRAERRQRRGVFVDLNKHDTLTKFHIGFRFNFLTNTHRTTRRLIFCSKHDTDV
jgi:hypothetical protein